MFTFYLKTTFRNLWKNKTYSFLNIAGLALGIACASLIFLWVEDELNFDSSHLNKDLIYIFKTNNKVDNGVVTHSSTPGPLAPAIEATIPGIALTCRSTEKSSHWFRTGEKSVNASGMFVEPSFFSLFTLPFVQGHAREAFSHLHAIVLTERSAAKMFGTGVAVMGKTVTLDNKQEYIVTGVLKDLPSNSTIQFEWLAPFKAWYDANPRASTWFNFGLTTYAQLKPGTDAAAINKQLLDPLYNFTTQRKEHDGSSVHVFLFGMSDWHLREDFENGVMTGSGRILYVKLFSTIAWIILFIACINFMNLATAGSEKRAKEIGVRKVLGSGKGKLVTQFIGEAMLMALLAVLVAVAMIQLVLPGFNQLVEKDLSAGLSNPVHALALLLITLLCGLVAGSYPALYLSSFNPVVVLKSMKVKTGTSSLVRKGLVVVQFSVSIVLIISTIVIYQQIQHVKGRDIGYNKDRLIQIAAQEDIVKNFAVLHQDLLNTGLVENAALADHTTIGDGNNTTSIFWEGKDPNSNIIVSQRLVSKEFMSTTGMHIVEGRDFDAADEIQFDGKHMPKDSAKAMNVIITQSMEKLMGKGRAIGKTLQLKTDRGNVTMQVAGVTKDYVYGDMYGQSAPVIFYVIPEAASLLYIRLAPGGNLGDVSEKLSGILKKYNPAYPFEFKFVDEQFNQLFLRETLVGKLSRIFASLAIIISCLGLFGLAAYTAERRTKEIGVRKVLGASVKSIAALLSGDFLQLVAVSCLVAFPLAWWMMSNWLQAYQYRIRISWWIFAIAGLAAILIALVTVSFQAIKAAVANPVKSLRTE